MSETPVSNRVLYKDVIRARVVADIPTPALVIDVPAMDRNIQRMARFFADGPCRLRPHFKAHKTPEIARRQLAAGSVTGLTCATVSEAEIAAPLAEDILIANEMLGPGKCDRVAALARGRSITIAADSVEGLDQMAAAARRAGVRVGVLVDLNVGQNRCGVAPGEAALALARQVVATAGLQLRGVMGYEGHLQPLADRTERETRTRQAMQALVATAQLLRDHGLPCDIVSAGGTGTHDISGRVPGVTEIQAGSYALMDDDYARLGLPFEQALFVLGTIISRPVTGALRGRLRAQGDDQGSRNTRPLTVSTARPWSRSTTSTPRSRCRRAPRLRSATASGCGRRTSIRPMNLHDVFYALEGDRVIDVWPIAARGYAEHRRQVTSATAE